MLLEEDMIKPAAIRNITVHITVCVSLLSPIPPTAEWKNELMLTKISKQTGLDQADWAGMGDGMKSLQVDAAWP